MKIHPSAWLVLLHACLTEQSVIQKTGNNTSYVHGAYYTSWSVYDGRTPGSMNVGLLSHVYYAFAMLDNDGNLYHGDPVADLTYPVGGQKGGLRALSSLKQQYPGLKVILSIGGGSGSKNFSSVASNKSKRARFAQSARLWVDEFGLDGIDIDWEHPQTISDGQNFLQLVQAARLKLPSPQYSISAALPADQGVLQYLPLSNLSQSLDQLNMMCYDFVGYWSTESGYQSPLYSPKTSQKSHSTGSCDSAISYTLTAGFSAGKVVLGIPAYGWSFLDTTAPGQRCNETGGSDGSFQYRDLPRPGAREFVNKDLVTAYSVGGDGGFVTYDNAETVTLKASYVKQRGLGGLFYWTGTGDAQGKRSLIRAGYNELYAK